ncbi:glutathione peroxidase [Papiliotrema laurentii]|uniref:Glutathione peroxidase n=1 Tax=Papiliotrema laurentii TaxID=5418 RepID=A0AAD9FNW3_PAPLA|nr:glutathione peroxidase [Papiliotrema laurentii]
MFTNIRSTISGFLSESVDPSVNSKSFYDLKATLPGTKGEFDFANLKGKVTLIVNTASKCGYTYQYTGLEELHKTYGDRGLVVLGFPSNEFAGQDPGSDEQIAEFCQLNHGVTFPLMKKSEVNGKNMNDVFAWLKAHEGESGKINPIKWNFTKFLVDKEGKVVGRFGSGVKPEELKSEIEKYL